jgi:hypothetical protein
VSRKFGVLAVALLAGCVKKTVEIRVHDPGRVGVNAIVGSTIVPVLPADGLDRAVPLAEPQPGQRPTVYREGRLVAVSWPALPPMSIVDPTGVLPVQGPESGIAMREGWLYSTYLLTPNRILPEGSRAEFAYPIVVTTPLANVADAQEIHEPRHWPAYVFLPTGGVFTVAGAGLLAVSRGDDEYKLAGVTYLLVGVPLVAYGVINALASAESAPLDLLPGRSTASSLPSP